MAEGNKQEETPGNWWDGWLQVAKDKSTAALELVKKDLSEFTCTVRTDTSNAVAATSDTLQQTIQTEKREPAMSMVKSGISSFLDGITRVLTIPPDDDPGDKLTIQPNGEATYDRSRARLTAIQLDPGTYCSQPSGPVEQYEMWRENFDLECKKGDISEMLVSRVEVRALYTKLVPSEVSHADFWARYFYKVHQLELDEARKVALMKRAEQTRDESFSWDDDEGSDSEDKTIPPAEVGKVTTERHETRQTNPDSPSNTQKSTPPQTMKDLSETFANANPSSSNLNVQKPKGTTETCGPSSTGTVSENLTKDMHHAATEETSQPQEPTCERKPGTVTSPNVPDSGNQTAAKESGVTQGSGKQVKSEENAVSDEGISGKQTKPTVTSATGDKVADTGVKVDSKTLTELKMREKGDMVVVGSGSSSPVSEASANVKKEAVAGEATDEDWEEDFDIELTEEDIRLAEEAAKKYKSPETLEDLDLMDEEDWNWD
ncbi:BSD domain-containing protein 1-like [Liolophura sinensis]|uniref:BSD domain-containing protein 1-like n=1 Tax=Liolophura sinensis TaxID=3198878 RepID=UPI00315889A2